MKSIFTLLTMFMSQIGSSERDYLFPLTVAFLTNEVKRIGLQWTPEQISGYASNSVDLFIAEEIHGANQLLATVNAK